MTDTLGLESFLYPPSRRRQGGYGNRPDGTAKGGGWLGEVRSADGSTMTELTIGVGVNGREMQIPLLVPTLSDEEIRALAAGGRPSESMVEKAVDHALMRQDQNKSPYIQDDDTYLFSSPLRRK